MPHLILSREFWFCLLLQIAQIGTYEPIFSYMVAFTLDKLQIYYPCDPTTTLIPKTSETSPVSLAFFYCLTFFLVLWLLTSTFTVFPMFLKELGCLEHTDKCYIFFHIVAKMTSGSALSADCQTLDVFVIVKVLFRIPQQLIIVKIRK